MQYCGVLWNAGIGSDANSVMLFLLRILGLAGVPQDALQVSLTPSFHLARSELESVDVSGGVREGESTVSRRSPHCQPTPSPHSSPNTPQPRYPPASPPPPPDGEQPALVWVRRNQRGPVPPPHLSGGGAARRPAGQPLPDPTCGLVAARLVKRDI